MAIQLRTASHVPLFRLFPTAFLPLAGGPVRPEPRAAARAVARVQRRRGHRAAEDHARPRTPRGLHPRAAGGRSVHEGRAVAERLAGGIAPEVALVALHAVGAFVTPAAAVDEADDEDEEDQASAGDGHDQPQVQARVQRLDGVRGGGGVRAFLPLLLLPDAGVFNILALVRLRGPAK